MVSVRDLQRNYRKIFNRVKSTKEPILVSCRGRPEIAIVSLKFLQDIAQSLRESHKKFEKEGGEKENSD